MIAKLYIYYLTHFTYGVIFTVFGPLIPYLSEATGLIQSQFTYIFALRGVAYLIAGLSQKTILDKYDHHHRMIVSCFLTGIGFIMFQMFYTHSFLLGIISLIMNMSLGSIQVLVNVCLVQASKGKTKQVVSFSYGIYGFGAIIGPIIVSLFGLYTLIICGLWVIFLGTLYFFSQPFRNQQQKQSIQNLNKSNQQLLVQKKQSKQISSLVQWYFCALFLLYAAITLSFRSWLPSFAVMQGIASKQNAALSISIYSGVLTAFRFFFIYINIETNILLQRASSILVLVLSLSLLSYWLQFYVFVVFGSSALLGIIFASYVPYLYALPPTYGKQFSTKNTSNSVISYAIGQAILSALVGYLMQWIHPLMLFISLFLMSIINKIVLEKTISSLQEDKNFEGDQNNELQMLESK